MKSRRALRAEMRRARRAVSRAERARKAECLARLLSGWLRVRQARTVACYLANDGEMNLAPVMARLRASGARLFLPALHGDVLWFLPFEPDTPLVVNRFGIAEPEPAASRRCRAPDLDLVLVPLVAFDSAGNRLGMGGGFYDRTFRYLRDRRVWKRPRLVGIAYELQRLDALPSRPWDVPLHGVATEKHLYRFR